MNERAKQYAMSFGVALLYIIFFAVLLSGVAQGQYPTPRPPLNTPPTPAQTALGEELFHERGLSIDQTVSCADCHQPKRGFSDGLPTAVGVGGRVGNIHTPTLVNVALKLRMFHDGRTDTIEDQVLQPLVNPAEMANQSVNQVINRLRRTPYYVKRFAETYRNGITRDTLAHAVASYENTILSFDAPIDDYMSGDDNAINDAAKRGLELFALHRCDECHPYPLLTDHQFHNNGANFRVLGGNRPRGRNGVLPGNLRRDDLEGAVVTATLRDITRSAPYMVTGRYPSLESVIRSYSQGMVRNDGTRDRFCDPRAHGNASQTNPRFTEEDEFCILELFKTFETRSYPYSGMDRN